MPMPKFVARIEYPADCVCLRLLTALDWICSFHGNCVLWLLLSTCRQFLYPSAILPVWGRESRWDGYLPFPSLPSLPSLQHPSWLPLIIHSFRSSTISPPPMTFISLAYAYTQPCLLFSLFCGHPETGPQKAESSPSAPIHPSSTNIQVKKGRRDQQHNQGVNWGHGGGKLIVSPLKVKWEIEKWRVDSYQCHRACLVAVAEPHFLFLVFSHTQLGVNRVRMKSQAGRSRQARKNNG
jgi:hypothetical protein